MRIEIEIPKEFEGDYDADKFSDFFSRAMIDIETMQGMCGRYEVETAEMFRKAFAESKLAYDVEAKVAELKNIKTGGDCRHKCKHYDWSVGWCEGHCEDYVKETAISIVRGKE
jgi:hypothetical protein